MSNTSYWFNKRIFVTGHTGFKGTWLIIYLLESGAFVSGFSHEVPKNSLYESIHAQLLAAYPKYSHNIGNICDSGSLETAITQSQPEYIFHLAAQALVHYGYENPLETWHTNVYGTLNLLEASKSAVASRCILVIVSTDKVYKNKNWIYGYRECDPLGGSDPYSASKSAMEIAVKSWNNSFIGDSDHQVSNLSLATVRAGNVIGGGDWATNRIVPDSIRALLNSSQLCIRNPLSRRPWQHVLEPISGYLQLAQYLSEKRPDTSLVNSFNFGPSIHSNRTVIDLVDRVYSRWSLEHSSVIEITNHHFEESPLLHLNSEKAFSILGWQARWTFEQTVDITIDWYQHCCRNPGTELEKCLENIQQHISANCN